MSIWIKRLTFVIAATLLFLAAQPDTLAGSATWGLNPSSADWTTAGNWVPSTVPNGASDIATFGSSSVTNLFINSTIVEVDSIAFNSGASPYTISVEVSNLFLSGTGVVNNSGSVQSFVTPITENNNGAIFFSNNATAGEMTNFGGEGGDFVFNDSSSAGSATFDVTSGGLFQASMTFWDNTTAADATITVSLGIVGVYENATAGNAVITETNDAILFIADDATADHAVATCIHGSSIDFQQFASAGEGHFTAVGATSSGEAGSDIEFTGSATAANGTFVINGGTGPDVAGAFMTFLDSTTAGNVATITVNGGVSGGGGSAIFFEGHSKGGTASLSLLGNGEMDIGNSRTAAGVTIGSLEGDGMVFLGPKTLAIGSNNQSTTFSGVIQDGGISQGTGGSLTKRGRGTLILTGANTYTGATTVSGGALKVTNTFGSGTGTGAVQLNAGTLGRQRTHRGSDEHRHRKRRGRFSSPVGWDECAGHIGISKRAYLQSRCDLHLHLQGQTEHGQDRRGVRQWDHHQQRRDDCLEGSDPGATHYRPNSDSDQQHER